VICQRYVTAAAEEASSDDELEADETAESPKEFSDEEEEQDKTAPVATAAVEVSLPSELSTGKPLRLQSQLTLLT